MSIQPVVGAAEQTSTAAGAPTASQEANEAQFAQQMEEIAAQLIITDIIDEARNDNE